MTCTCIALRGVLKSVLQESQGLISTHADFQVDGYQFCILIHNTLLGEITVTEKLYLYSPVRNDIYQHTKILILLLLSYASSRRIRRMDKMWKSFFQILHHSTTNFCILVIFLHILHLDIIKSEINFKLKVKMNKTLGFQWDRP